MKLSKLHRKILAAVFMAVYLFIAMPVSYWHSHQDNATTQQDKCNKSAVSKTTDASSTDCPVCSHHYPAGLNDHFVFHSYRPVSTEPVADKYTLPVYETPVLLFSNKGPPAIS